MSINLCFGKLTILQQNLMISAGFAFAWLYESYFNEMNKYYEVAAVNSAAGLNLITLGSFQLLKITCLD